MRVPVKFSGGSTHSPPRKHAYVAILRNEHAPGMLAHFPIAGSGTSRVSLKYRCSLETQQRLLDAYAFNLLTSASMKSRARHLLARFIFTLVPIKCVYLNLRIKRPSCFVRTKITIFRLGSMKHITAGNVVYARMQSWRTRRCQVFAMDCLPEHHSCLCCTAGSFQTSASGYLGKWPCYLPALTTLSSFQVRANSTSFLSSLQCVCRHICTFI